MHPILTRDDDLDLARLQEDGIYAHYRMRAGELRRQEGPAPAYRAGAKGAK
jgi:hypothetical protein